MQWAAIEQRPVATARHTKSRIVLVFAHAASAQAEVKQEPAPVSPQPGNQAIEHSRKSEN